MPEYTADFDDDLGDAEAIQALSNAEKNHDVKPHIKVPYYIGSILIQYQVVSQGTLLNWFYVDLLYWFNIDSIPGLPCFIGPSCSK